MAPFFAGFEFAGRPLHYGHVFDAEASGLAHSTTWEKHGVSWKYEGVVTGEELLRSNLEIYGDLRFDAMHYQIVDLTGVSRFDVSSDDMIAIAATDRAAAITNPHVRVAVVAHDDLMKRLSVVYEQENERSPWAHAVFDTEAQARAWAAGWSSESRV